MLKRARLPRPATTQPPRRARRRANQNSRLRGPSAPDPTSAWRISLAEGRRRRLREPMPLRTASAAALTAFALVLSAPCNAATAAQVSVVGGRHARTVKVEASGGGHIARLFLLVRNDSTHSAPLEVRFFSADGPKRNVRVNAQPQTLKPGQTKQASIRLTLTRGTDLKGTVVIGLRGRPRTRDAAIPVASKAAASSPGAVEPAEVTLHVTRHCPQWLDAFLCGGHGDAIVWVSGGVLSATDKSKLARLASSSSGGSAIVRLSALPKPAGNDKDLVPPAGLTLAKVTTEARGHGSYSTTFVVDKSAKQDGQLKVNVDVQDWWFWPLLVLLVGAIFGYLTRWLMGTYRDRRILMSQLKKARKSYSRRIPTRSPGIYGLDDWFGGLDDPVPGIPRRGECQDTDDLSGFAVAWCNVRQARSGDDIDAAGKTVDQLVADLRIWRRVDAALRHLGLAFESAVPPAVRSDETPAYADVRGLIEAPLIPMPTKTEEADKQIAALRAQEGIVKVYEPGRDAWTRVADAEKNGLLKDSNPFTIYGETGGVLERKPDAAVKLKQKLRDAAEKLATYATPLTPGGVTPPSAPQSGGLNPFQQFAAAVLPDKIAKGIGIPLPPTPETKPDAWFGRVTTAIDWFVFIATLLVSAVVYLLTLYSGKHFGAVNQYVQAFGAGFAGQALVGVATIPLARSLVAITPKKGAAGSST
jgi:hypothetical protein